MLDFVCLHESSRPCNANLRTVMRNFDSELPLFQLTFLTMTAHCSSTSSVSSQASKWLQNRLPSDTDRLNCPPSWMNLCTVRVTWPVRSTSETALLFNPLKFAEFHNQSPLLTTLTAMVEFKQVWSSKTWVAPIKKQTIPRLELLGATILARLVSTVINLLTKKIDPVVYWIESWTVLCWIRNEKP